jgi:transposase InsO family protein
VADLRLSPADGHAPRQGWCVNEKRVRRLIHELHLAADAPKRRPSTTNSEPGFPRFENLVEGLEVVRPEQVRVADRTHVRLHHEFVYLAVLMDLFTRAIRGWNPGKEPGRDLDGTGLEAGLGPRLPPIHHSDQGV